MMSSNMKSAILFSVRHGDFTTVKNLIDKHGMSNGIDWYYFLVEALTNKRSDVAKLLLSSGARVNNITSSPSSFDITPLHIAVRNNEKEIIEMLLEKGAAINVRGGKMKCTPLYEAVLHNRIQIAEMLLKGGALVDIRNDEDKTPLMIAVERGHIDGLRLLIQNGANVNAVCSMSQYDGFVPLHLAAIKGSKDIVDLLLAKGALVDAKTANMSTPLHLAVDREMKNVVQVLLNSHADVNARTTANETPLHMAVRRCSKDIVELLLKADSCVNAQTADSKTSLHLAVSRGDKDVVDVLLKSGADVNAKDDDLCIPLLTAVRLNREDLVECLLRSGADINTASSDSRTSLHVAVENHSTEIVDLLLRNGANANAQIEDFRTPLHVAVESRTQTTSIVELLLNYGANVNAKLLDSDTALHLAIRNWRLGVVSLLLERGADVDAEDKDCNTPLCLAVQDELPLKTFHEILKYRPDINSTSNQNALSIATRRIDRDKEEIINAMLAYGFPVKSEDAQDSSIVSCVIRNGLVSIAQEIFKHCPNTILEFNVTPLHLASFYKQLEIAKLLLEYGADINAQAAKRRTPIYFAVAKADLDMFELFLSCQAIVKGAHELLHLAVKSGSLVIVKSLLDRGFKVDVRHEMGRTALHWTNFSLKSELQVRFSHRFLFNFSVRSSGDLETHRRIAEYLLLNGADVNARDNNRDTPLHIAAREGSYSVAEVFLKHGGDVSSRDRFGDTALCSSVRYNYLDLSRLFLKAGAKVDTKIGSVTPLHLATDAGDVEHVKLLLDYGANVDATCEGGTALHIATSKQDLNLVKLLLGYCADVNAKCDEETALHISASMGSNAECLVETLLEYGADINITTKNNETPIYCSHQSSPLIFHLIKMKVANLYLCERNLLFLKTDSLVKHYGSNSRLLQTLVEFSSECEKETAILKRTKIGHFSVTYWHILTKSNQQLVRTLANETIVETLNTGKQFIEDTFPMYASMIWNRFKYGKRRRKLEKESKRIFFDYLFNGLPYICIDKILSYLSDKDLHLLILAFP